MKLLHYSVMLLIAASVALAGDDAYFFSPQTVTMHFDSRLAGYRVLSFNFAVRGANIYGLNGLPPGWDVSIDNSSSGITKVSGRIDVAAAAVPIESLAQILTVTRPKTALQQFDIVATFRVENMKTAEEQDVIVPLAEMSVRK